jgi:hypothetical protein
LLILHDHSLILFSFSSTIPAPCPRTRSCASQAHASLTSLDLASNPLGDAGVLKLTDALRTHPALTELHLECTECGDVGASALAQQLAVDAPPELPHANRPPPFVLSPLPAPPPGEANVFGRTLRQLFLNNNSIADQGARALATALSFNATVTELYLGFNQIADQGAIDLAYMLSIRNGTLNVLHLWRNPFGESVEKGMGESAGYTAVREALAINTTLTSYDGPAGPLLNASVRQTNRTAYLRMVWGWCCAMHIVVWRLRLGHRFTWLIACI